MCSAAACRFDGAEIAYPKAAVVIAFVIDGHIDPACPLGSADGGVGVDVEISRQLLADIDVDAFVPAAGAPRGAENDQSASRKTLNGELPYIRPEMRATELEDESSPEVVSKRIRVRSVSGSVEVVYRHIPT